MNIIIIINMHRKCINIIQLVLTLFYLLIDFSSEHCIVFFIFLCVLFCFYFYFYFYFYNDVVHIPKHPLSASLVVYYIWLYSGFISLYICICICICIYIYICLFLAYYFIFFRNLLFYFSNIYWFCYYLAKPRWYSYSTSINLYSITLSLV